MRQISPCLAKFKQKAINAEVHLNLTEHVKKLVSWFSFIKDSQKSLIG